LFLLPFGSPRTIAIGTAIVDDAVVVLGTDDVAVIDWTAGSLALAITFAAVG